MKRFPLITLMLLGLSIGLLWAEADQPDPSRFEVATLAEGFDRPMGMDRAPDGRIFVIELAGRILAIDPATGTTGEVGKLDVFADQENGLIGIVLDPHFAENKWIYLHYSPVDFAGQHLSRFTLTDGKIDMASEKVLLQWETQRRECCHHAGMLLFGPDGCLYASAGDNTHPFGDSQSYAPLDRRPGREPWNAEKSAANPNDLRGGIIRIRPKPDGTYEIPEGNLFPPGTPGTRPEIYVMGCRNPWKISIDAVTGYLYWGEVGPDAGGDGERGPRGYDEINQARQAGFFGWPYFIADNQAYAMVDFATGKVGARFDPAKPVNDSPLNTGRQDLPPAQPAFLSWPYGPSEKFPELGQGGRTACAGPVFHFRESFAESGGLPPFYDNCLLFWDWQRPFIMWARLDADSNFAGFEEFILPAGVSVKRAANAIFGPDGSLYLLDYGSTWGANTDSKLLHLSYQHGNLDPVAKIEASATHGALPLTVEFDASRSIDPEGQPLACEWSVQPVPQAIPAVAKVSLTFDQPGDHLVTLRVTDPDGATATASTVVVAGNTPPKVAITAPREGSFYDPGRPIPFRLHIVDAEDGDSEVNPGPFAAAVVTLAPSQRESPGLAAIRASDCFNCHHASQKLVGPAFTEIAARYGDSAEAFEQSVQRVRNGSANVWGPVPMLPHAQLEVDRVRAMVRWIYDLKAGSAPQVARGISGEIDPPAVTTALELSANFTDASQGGSTALSGGATIRLHSRLIEAEGHDAHHGTQNLAGGSAGGGEFVGAVNDGDWTEYRQFLLEGSKLVTFRVASGGAGGTIRLHAGDLTLATVEVAPTGGWEDWREITAPLKNVPDGAVDLRLSFGNPGKGGLLNVDWFRIGE